MKINPIGHLVKTNPNKPNSNPIKACPDRSEFTLSVIEGNGPISNGPSAHGQQDVQIIFDLAVGGR
jgi:hypothetical protein